MVDCRIARLLALVALTSACFVPNPLFLAGVDSGELTTGDDPSTTDVAGTTSGTGPDSSGPASTAEPASTTSDEPVCGNGMHEPGEQCDDGNRIPGDDCEVNCRQLFRPYDEPLDGTKDAVALALGDLDGDGDDDLALGFATCTIGQACVRTWLNDGDGGFSEGETIPVGEAPARLFIADWDVDQTPDILATHAGGYVTLALLGSDQLPAELAVFGDMRAAIIADIDGDDLPDLAVPDEAGLKIYYVLANGSGFTQATTVEPALAPRHLAVTDVDGDAEADVLYTVYTGPVTGFSLKLGFEGADIGPFTSNANNAGAIAIGEFGVPPWPNVVYSDPVGDTLQVFNNKGGGQFDKSSDTIDAEPGMLRLVAARLNSDDADNILALAPSALQIFTYEDGQVVSGPSRYFSGTGLDVAVGHLGGDDRVDVAVLTTYGLFALINQSGE